jgi:hypothetical protein
MWIQPEYPSIPTLWTHRLCWWRLLHWQWLQGEGQVTNFLKYWRTDGQLGTTLRITVSWFQYKAGVSWSLFNDVTTTVNYTHARWLPSLHNFLGTIDGHFQLDDIYVSPSQREYDVHLMDIVTRSDTFTSKEARIINYCRLFLDVITLSDITNATGDALIPGIEWGELDNTCSVSTNHTTRQPAPAVFFWTYWQRLLRVVANSDGKLFGKLGNWQQPGGQLRRL